MSTNKTEHYGLHAWEPGDDFVRAEFNENFAKLDTALAALAQGMGDKLELVTGSYIGDDRSGQTIVLGFQPKFVILVNSSGLPYAGSDLHHQMGGFFFSGMGGYNMICSLNANGFSVYTNGITDYVTANDKGQTYCYIAFR